MDHKMVSILLNDHLATATAGIELARRARGSNDEGELASFLDRVEHDLEANLAVLHEVMVRLNVGPDRLKQLAGWSGEKLGRLKPNGRLTSYSPMSRVTELSSLTLIYQHQLLLWRSLERLFAGEPEFSDVDLAARAERSERLREETARHATEAVETAVT